jgi:hypothetical protein
MQKMTKAKIIIGRINGEFIKSNNVTTLTILSVPDYGKFEKLECKVRCNDTANTQGDWQLNAQSNNALINKFQDDTEKWVTKTIPVQAHEYKSGIGINVDVAKLEGTL